MFAAAPESGWALTYISFAGGLPGSVAKTSAMLRCATSSARFAPMVPL